MIFKEEREGQRYEQSARQFIQEQVYCHPFKEWLSRFSVAILHRPDPVKRRAIQKGDVGLLALYEGRFGSMARGAWVACLPQSKTHTVGISGSGVMLGATRLSE